MLTSLLLAAATDPTTVSPATTDKVVNWAIQAPLTVAFFLLLGAIGYTGRWVVREAFPKWLEEQEKNRQQREVENEKTRAHFATMLEKRSEDASKDVAQAHAEIGERVDEVRVRVVSVSGQVDVVAKSVDAAHSKLDGVHALVRALASKQGLGVVLLLVLCGTATLVGKRLLASTAYTCNPKCEAPAWCCKTDVCCRNASAASACIQPVPHSSATVAFDYGDDPWAEQDYRRTSL